MKKKSILLLCAILAVVLACGAWGDGLFTRVTVTLTVGDETHNLHAQPGDVLNADELASFAMDGERIVAWISPSGQTADLSEPVEYNASYTALVAPALAEEMEPWLSPDENGLVHPDALVSGEEVADGISALFADYEPDGMDELETVSESELFEVLYGLFAPELLESLSGTEPMTRIECAQVLYPLYMNSLYGDSWGYDTEYRVVAADLDPLRDGADAMAECVDESGAVHYEEGLVNLDGYLYRADDAGLFYMDETVDGLYYGPDGRYTSGSAELDALVADALAPICDEYETREEMLRAAYLYVRDDFTYLRRNYYSVGDDGWQIDEAVTMLSTSRGNCYNYAAAFWALARGLGYDATAVAGTVGWDRDPHGWVIMYDAEGERITYDVELEMAYRYQRGRYDVDMYAMGSWKANQWNYIYGEQFG